MKRATRVIDPRTSSTADAPAAGLGARLLAVLAVAAAVVVANLYYNQPLLAQMAGSFGVSERAAGAIPAMTQLGYGAGMLALVPLGDMVERRGLIVLMTTASAAVLVLVALAPTLPLLVAASFALGVASMVPQYIVPYAANAAAPDARGRAVGTVMMGLLVGILLSRTVSGVVGARFGWRVVYGGAAVVVASIAIVLRLALPEQRPTERITLGALYASTLDLVRREPVLRHASVLGALSFAAFSVFWSTLAFHLATPPESYGSAVAGAFGAVGVVGALAAPLIGKFGDSRDPRIVNGVALALVVVSFVILGVAGKSLVGIAVGVIVLDVGAQANHIANQTRIFALSAALRNRLNTVYMGSFFAGGAIGSWLGAQAWSAGGWRGVSLAGGLLGAAGLALFARDWRRRSRAMA